MHGILFAEFRQYVELKMGPEVWSTLVEQAGLPNRTFLVARQFPDVEFQALAAAAARRMSTSVGAVLENFGEFVAPHLIRMHAHSLPAEWKTLDLVEHTEQAIHQVVREGDVAAFPPRIACTRVSEREAVVRYVSRRKLCSLAKGIVRGVAAQYGETVVITETTCMLKGADACTIGIEVRRVDLT